MSPGPKSQRASRRTAFVVLAVALAATLFATWRERELARRGQFIRWQDGLAQLSPILQEAFTHRFQPLFGQAKSSLRRKNFTSASWNEFLTDSEWQSHFPGMLEIGYAAMEDDRCLVNYVATRTNAPIHPPHFDLDSDPAIRESVQKSASSGFGLSINMKGASQGSVVFGLLPIAKQDLRSVEIFDNRTNVYGFIFFELDQKQYFNSVRPQLNNAAFDLTLLSPEEPFPSRTETRRTFTVTTTSGEWRLVATMKPGGSASLSPWIVLVSGTALSLLLYSLFVTQSRLRVDAELANQKTTLRDAEITALNRDLEQKVTTRTAELNDALAAEKELGRLKSNFISMVTHEIRTPLALILGSSEILSRYLDRLDAEERKEHLGTIESSVERMSALVEDVLVFSRAEAGRMEFHPTQIDLKQFCSQLVDELLSATKRRCPIEFVACDMDELARGDENLLRHIVANLVTNAAKYSTAGAPVRLLIRRESGDAIFIIEDRGVGIPKEDQGRLFTPFYRGKNVTPIRGTGLGLVIVKHCVERHGGEINIESAEKMGTTVTVRLPLFSPAHTEFIRKINTGGDTKV